MVRLNVGCGKLHLSGYANVDVVDERSGVRPDIVCDARLLAEHFGEAHADEILAVHVLEHFYEWEVDALLLGWKRVLKSGGKLVLELPDLRKACINLINGMGDQMTMWALYGDPSHRDPHMCHRWGWTPETLEKRLRELGFVHISHHTTHYHGAGRAHRDMRIEAVKP